ncbi:ATP-binding protein [Streptomyces sp. SID3343]|uniref:ATP-binding protein n=1 Tax=Streptomyces sp. SID3343 TaxID=2690260 RepID=UPI00136F76BB|nr:ATP-binding protein [Streptomyces sp. SID3343]MYV98205.1 ATP-binding protein [Streptomyces sp. SID3343]
MAGTEAAVAVPGFFLIERLGGFTVHICACQEHLSQVRELIDKTLCAAGVDVQVTGDAQVVVSELVGNAARACGDRAPLVVEASADADGVWVMVHDPMPERLPVRAVTALDDPDAETGRGIRILDALAPGWNVVPTPIGKQIRCRLAGADT